MAFLVWQVWSFIFWYSSRFWFQSWIIVELFANFHYQDNCWFSKKINFESWFCSNPYSVLIVLLCSNPDSVFYLGNSIVAFENSKFQMLFSFSQYNYSNEGKLVNWFRISNRSMRCHSKSATTSQQYRDNARYSTKRIFFAGYIIGTGYVTKINL